MTDTHVPIAAHATAHTATKSGFSCRYCGKHWNGLKTCHCATCHHTFSTVTSFDQHRRGTYEPNNRQCVNPTDAGLIRIGRNYECWGRAYSE